MKKYIFNENYFLSKYGENIGKGIEEISSKAKMSEASVLKKRSGERAILDADYKEIREKFDTLLILNVEKLVGKLILRANLDLTTNERFVLYNILCNFETLWFSVDDFTGTIHDGVYNKEIIHKILNDCMVKTDQSGKEELLYIKRYNTDRLIEEFSLNLTIAIKYTEHKDSE